MNCWIWIILLWLCSGRGGCRSNCICNDGCDNDSPCDSVFTTQGNSNTGCGCNNDMIQPRGFAGFGDSSTCGCEEKDN